jgi:hypothetical protein
MNNPFNFFEKIYYINPDFNFDKRVVLEEEFSKYDILAERLPGFSLSLEQSETITKNGGILDRIPGTLPYLAAVRGITLGHLQAIFLAKYQKFKNVLIFEDDVMFSDNILEDLSNCIEDLKGREWDMFFLGCNPVENFHQVTDHISKPGGVYMSHAYVVNHTFYDTILNFDFSRCWVFDQHVFGLVKNTNHKCFMSTKHLARQRPGFSGSVGNVVDYNLGVDHHYKINFKPL